MEKLDPSNSVESFKVDHTKLIPGLYVSRVDGCVKTYDLRTRTPNGGLYMSTTTMHSVEHMLVSFLRSRLPDKIYYFGPMGCRTGFYLLVDTSVPEREVLNLIKDSCRDVIKHEGKVFGQSIVECGNYIDLSLLKAKIECQNILSILGDEIGVYLK